MTNDDGEMGKPAMRQRGTRGKWSRLCGAEQALGLPGWRSRFVGIGLLLTWAGALALLLTACGAPSAGSSAIHAYGSGNAQAISMAQTAPATTQAAQAQTADPVSMTMFVQEQGSIASHHLIISITFTVTNQLSVPIHLYHACGPGSGPTEPSVHAFFLGSDGQTNSGFRISTESECPAGGPPTTYQPTPTPTRPAVDYSTALAPGTSQTWTYSEDDSANTSRATAGNEQLIVPDTYVVAGWVTWHTGTLGSAASSTDGFASAQTAVTLS